MPSAIHTCFILAAALFAAVPCVTAGSFTYNNSSFLLNGESFQIWGGQMDPQRVPKVYWSNRLALARAMGLNTIFSYVFWNEIETSSGKFNWFSMNNVSNFYKKVQKVGLQAVLQVGPYIDDEHEYEGLLSWLSEVPGMAVWQNNQPFLDAAKSYIDNLAKKLKGRFIAQDGPILMVQIENEYGFCGSDHTYTAALKDIFTSAFNPHQSFYTNDGGSQSALTAGAILGVLTEIDGPPQVGFMVCSEYLNASNQGPNLNGEYYTCWLTTWGFNSMYNHDTTDSSIVGGHIQLISSIQSDINFILTNQSLFSLYMFHGGTNWGYQNNGDSEGGSALMADTTTYDYGASLNESGHVMELYQGLWQTIFSYLSQNGSNNEKLPAIPEQNPLIEVSSFNLTPSINMFDALPAPVNNTYLIHMEALQQAYGFILYRTQVASSVQGKLQSGDYLWDHVLVYVNGQRFNILDYSYGNTSVVTLNLKKDDTLNLLIENMGRICFGCSGIFDQRKGVIDNVTVGGTVLKNWEIYSLPLNELLSFQKSSSSSSKPSPGLSSPSIFYTASVSLSCVGDTFFELSEWTKGIVWVNGVNLSRYWIVGPQQQLYLLGCYLKPEANKITVLALEPNSANSAHGITTCTWGNNSNSDASLTASF